MATSPQKSSPARLQNEPHRELECLSDSSGSGIDEEGGDREVPPLQTIQPKSSFKQKRKRAREPTEQTSNAADILDDSFVLSPNKGLSQVPVNRRPNKRRTRVR